MATTTTMMNSVPPPTSARSTPPDKPSSSPSAISPTKVEKFAMTIMTAMMKAVRTLSSHI